MDQLGSSITPAGTAETTAYTYDGDGNVKTITYPAASGTSETTTYSYNGEDRVTGIGYSDGEAPVVESYIADGQLAQMSDQSGHSTYLYDGLDRLISSCTDASTFITAASQCAADGGRLVSYGYNTDNDQTSVGYPNGSTVSQSFNAADQLTSVTDWLGNTTSFAYDADSDPVTTTFPTATNETDSSTYNLDDALTGITMNQTTSGTTTKLAAITLARYPDDLVQTESQTGLPGASSDGYTYTQQQEIASDTAGSSTSAYAYDGARNITELAGASGYGYSSNGDSELITSPAGTYAYNTLGERTTFTPTSGTATSYRYNANQNLTQAALPSSTVSYTYNARGQLQSSSTGSTTTPFTWDDTASAPELLAAGSDSYIYGPSGNAIEQISGGTVQYLHQDQIGSTRLITTSTGSAAGTFTYSPYGHLTASTGSASSLLGYAGEYTDPTTGLTYNQARWYDPTTGQFLTVDPKVESTWDPYAYASDNPVTNSDPSGLAALGDCLRVGDGKCRAEEQQKMKWGQLTLKDVGIGLGVVAAFTGVGDFADLVGGDALVSGGAAGDAGSAADDAAESGSALGKVSTATGAGATSIDAHYCLTAHPDAAACVGAATGIFGVAGGIVGVAPLAGETGQTVTSGARALGMTWGTVSVLSDGASQYGSDDGR